MFITFSDDLVEILGSLGRDGLQSEVIQDEQIASQNSSEVAGMRAVRAGDLQILQQAMGGFGQDAEIAFQGFNGNGVGEMAFSPSIVLPLSG